MEYKNDFLPREYLCIGKKEDSFQNNPDLEGKFFALIGELCQNYAEFDNEWIISKMNEIISVVNCLELNSDNLACFEELWGVQEAIFVNCPDIEVIIPTIKCLNCILGDKIQIFFPNLCKRISYVVYDIMDRYLSEVLEDSTDILSKMVCSYDEILFVGLGSIFYNYKEISILKHIAKVYLSYAEKCIEDRTEIGEFINEIIEHLVEFKEFSMSSKIAYCVCQSSHKLIYGYLKSNSIYKLMKNLSIVDPKDYSVVFAVILKSLDHSSFFPALISYLDVHFFFNIYSNYQEYTEIVLKIISKACINDEFFMKRQQDDIIPEFISCLESDSFEKRKQSALVLSKAFLHISNHTIDHCFDSNIFEILLDLIESEDFELIVGILYGFYRAIVKSQKVNNFFIENINQIEALMNYEDKIVKAAAYNILAYLDNQRAALSIDQIT